MFRSETLTFCRVFIVKEAAMLPGTVWLFGRSSHAEPNRLSDRCQQPITGEERGRWFILTNHTPHLDMSDMHIGQ